MALIAQLLARLGLDSSGFDAGAKRATRSLHDLQKEATAAQTKMARWVSAAGSIATVEYAARRAYTGLMSIANAAAEDEQAQLRLATALRTFSAATDKQVASLDREAEALSRTTVYTDDEIRSQMALAASLGVSAGNILSVTKASIGLSHAYGKDLPASLVTLKAALDGDIAKLRSFGISVKDSASAIETTSALIEKATKGYSDAVDSYAGLTKGLKETAKAWNEVKEEAGRALGPDIVVGAEKIVRLLDDMRLSAHLYASDLRNVVANWKLLFVGAPGPVAPHPEVTAARRTHPERYAPTAAPSAPKISPGTTEWMRQVREQAAKDEAAQLKAYAIAQQRESAQKELKRLTEQHGEQIDAEIASLHSIEAGSRQRLWTESEAQKIQEYRLLGLDKEVEAAERMRQANNERLDDAKRLRAAEDDIGNAFKANMDDMLFEGKSWGDAMIDIVKKITMEIVNMLIIEKAAKGFASAVSGGIGSIFGGLFHTGSWGGTRAVPALAYAGAPRLHNGYFGANEFPAILERGETVIPRGGMQAQVNIINQTSSEVKGRVTGSSFDGKRYVTSIVLEDFAQNGQIRQTMEKMR